MKARPVNFERGQDPKDALEIGLWKPFRDIFVNLEEFKEKGGILTNGREIFNSNNSYIGSWIGYDDEQQRDLIQNSSWKSMHVSVDYGVRIKCKVMYK